MLLLSTLVFYSVLLLLLYSVRPALLAAHSHFSLSPSRSPLYSDAVPSFILMAIKGNTVVTYVYELRGEEVTVSKSEFTKK